MAVAAVGLCGCSGIGTDFTVTRTFPVVASEADPSCATTRGRVNLEDEAAFRDARAHIGGLRLEALTLTVGTVAEGNVATRADGTLRIAETETGPAQTLGMFAGLAVEENAAQDLAIDMNTSAQLSRLILTPPHVLFVEGEGCSDQRPAIYALEAKLTFFASVRP